MGVQGGHMHREEGACIVGILEKVKGTAYQGRRLRGKD